jgi:hypothetical protein
MLLLLLVWLIILASSVVTGAALLKSEDTSDPFPSAALLGLVSLPVPLLLISLASPLRLWHFLAVYAIAPAALFVARRPVLPFPQWMPLGVLLAANAWNSAGEVTLYDTGLYHYPLIRWLNEFGTVPGQALLHHRFGFSSPWLAVPAALDFGPLAGRTAAILNGLVLALAMYHFVLAVSRWLRGEPRRTDSFFLAGYLVCFLFGAAYQRFEVSASPNWPVAVLVLFACASPAVPAFLFAAAATGIKLSVLPLLVCTALRLKRRPWIGAAAGLFFVAPAIVANYVSSGCPFYPAESFCSTAESSVGPARARAVNLETRNWARSQGLPLDDPNLMRLDWLPGWLARGPNLPLSALTILSILMLSLRRAWSFEFLLASVGLLYVLLAAPDFRFGFGYVACLAGLAFQTERWKPAPWRLPIAVIAVAAASCLLCNTWTRQYLYQRWLNARINTLTAAQLIRPDLIPYRDAQGKAVRARDFFYYEAPVPDQCWGAKPPCTQFPVVGVGLCFPAKGIRGGLCRSVRTIPTP